MRTSYDKRIIISEERKLNELNSMLEAEFKQNKIDFDQKSLTDLNEKDKQKENYSYDGLAKMYTGQKDSNVKNTIMKDITRQILILNAVNQKEISDLKAKCESQDKKVREVKSLFVSVRRVTEPDTECFSSTKHEQDYRYVLLHIIPRDLKRHPDFKSLNIDKEVLISLTGGPMNRSRI